MPKKSKTGKSRLDKYYYLAKEEGYRSRAAFKLVHIDQKFNVLKGAESILDLCAAPGGWLQVAHKYTSPKCCIIGVDLDAIKPIHPRVQTFMGDITTSKCRSTLREMLKAKGKTFVDLVVHDGAPNVSANRVGPNVAICRGNSSFHISHDSRFKTLCELSQIRLVAHGAKMHTGSPN